MGLSILRGRARFRRERPRLGGAGEGRAGEVLRRPRDAPRGDDRVLRAALVRAARCSSRCRCSGATNQAEPSSFFVRELQRTFPSTSVDSILRAVRRDPGERDRARARRRRVPALVVAVALQRARERLQHRLRPAQPRLPAREGAGVADDGRLARRALRRARGRARSARSCCGGTRASSTTRSSRRSSRSACRSVGIFVFLATVVLRAHERGADWREVLPGAVAAAVILEATFQLLPRVRPACRATTRCCRRSRGRRCCSSGST